MKNVQEKLVQTWLGRVAVCGVVVGAMSLGSLVAKADNMPGTENQSLYSYCPNPLSIKGCASTTTNCSGSLGVLPPPGRPNLAGFPVSVKNYAYSQCVSGVLGGCINGVTVVCAQTIYYNNNECDPTPGIEAIFNQTATGCDGSAGGSGWVYIRPANR